MSEEYRTFKNIVELRLEDISQLIQQGKFSEVFFELGQLYIYVTEHRPNEE